MSMFETFTLPEFRSVEESVGDPMFSTYLRKQFVNLDIGKTGHVRNNKPQMVSTTICQREKRILQTRKQLQLGCAGKAEQFHAHEEPFLTSEEWRNSNVQNWEIQMEIGDAIMDDIVKETIVSFLG
ncbi:uncharacterized protein LOC114725400 [Neltuma alba]|nr:uncharacterized protein LOC114725400 [Prosopis alba]